MSASAWATFWVGTSGLLAQAGGSGLSLPAALVGAILLAAFCFAAGYWFRSGAATARTAETRIDAGDLPDELVVVLAAAVAEALGPAHRIVRIRGLMPEDLGWQLEGRMQHHASHHPRR